MTERQIQEAVARADIIICEIIRWAGIIILLMAVLFICILAVRHFAREEPPMIDYDAPGVDITSEGPDGYTDEYYRW